MLGYFRINDPYRLVIIFILLLLVRLPYLLTTEWLSMPELKWMIIGERLNEGALLYADLWDDISPLSALVYKSIDFVFGRSQRTFLIFGLFVFYFQIFYMNYTALRHKMYNENNYLPALFYGLMGLIFFNMVTLSPQLMGLTFVMFSIDSLLSHIETRNKTDANLLNIGLFTGIACMFYLPFILIMVVHLVILLFFTNTIKRRYLLMIYGLFIPFGIIWLFYLWQGQSSAFIQIFLFSVFHTEADNFMEIRSILFLTGFTIFLYIISSLKILSSFGFNIFQVRIQKTMFFASIVCLLIWLFYADHSGTGLIIFLPWTAFFLSHFFLSIRHRIKRELSFLFYFLSVIVLHFGVRYQALNLSAMVNISSLMVDQQKISAPPPYSGRKILVLGPDFEPYFYGKQATPYLNWEISKVQWEALNYYDNLEAIDRNIRSDMPEYIVDQVDIVSIVFDKIPLLGEEYEKVGDGLYKNLNRF